MRKRPVIVLGHGGHAGVVASCLSELNIPLEGSLAPEPGRSTIAYLGSDRYLRSADRGAFFLVNGVGSVRDTSLRGRVYSEAVTQGYEFLDLVHPSVILASDVVMGDAVQLMAGVVVQAGTRIGANVLVNTGAIVDHDCCIDDHCHIAPGVTLSGGVSVGQFSHIGVGAIVLQGITIGKNALVGAGSVVTRDVADGACVVGVPAREKK
ncbi:acetyltransferase [Terasakiella pusilla]|uniref:acetyltransferase n=1 Tax=Terasakiella pusilla TaxID=64973 RepID=UPI000490B55C|nr:acetyltransferase [Terasakiella pusilla]